jgi:hypothetical protein
VISINPIPLNHNPVLPPQSWILNRKARNPMLYHIPANDYWRPSDLAAALRDLDIEAEVTSDQRVLAVVPILEFLEIDKWLAATPEERAPKTIGKTTTVLSFCSDWFIENIVLEFEFNVLTLRNRYPDTSRVTQAIEKCGYASGSQLELVQLYLPDDEEVIRWIGEIETMNLRKEDRIADNDFAGAGQVLREQTTLRMRIEEKIRNRPRDLPE